MSELRSLLDGVAAGRWPPGDGSVRVMPSPDGRLAGVLAFTGCAVVMADVDPSWVARTCPAGDLSAPLCPPFLAALSAHLGRHVGNIDLVVVAGPIDGPPALELTPEQASDHPRVLRAHRYRTEVRMWSAPGAILTLGRGVGGRWELSIEIDAAARRRRLGRDLLRAVRSHLPDGAPVWAQIAPGNAASVRAFLAAGYQPVGAEALLAGERCRET